VAETGGRNEGCREPIERSPERHPQVEVGEVTRRRPRLVKRAVSHHRRGKEDRDPSQRREKPRLVFRLGQGKQGECHRGQVQIEERGRRDDSPVAEYQHEGEQIERERQHPKQRGGGDIGRPVGGEGGKQGRREQRKPHPAQAARGAGAVSLSAGAAWAREALRGSPAPSLWQARRIVKTAARAAASSKNPSVQRRLSSRSPKAGSSTKG